MRSRTRIIVVRSLLVFVIVTATFVGSLWLSNEVVPETPGVLENRPIFDTTSTFAVGESVPEAPTPTAFGSEAESPNTTEALSQPPPELVTQLQRYIAARYSRTGQSDSDDAWRARLGNVSTDRYVEEITQSGVFFGVYQMAHDDNLQVVAEAVIDDIEAVLRGSIWVVSVTVHEVWMDQSGKVVKEDYYRDDSTWIQTDTWRADTSIRN